MNPATIIRNQIGKRALFMIGAYPRGARQGAPVKTLVTEVDSSEMKHAPWCAARKDDDLDACDCDPCTGCDGHGQYTDDDGADMNCIACNNLPWKHPGTRHRTDR